MTLLRLNLWRGWLQAKRNFIGCFGAMVALLGAVGLLIGLIYAGQVMQQQQQQPPHAIIRERRRPSWPDLTDPLAPPLRPRR